jgi:hypothetical protein
MGLFSRFFGVAGASSEADGGDAESTLFPGVRFGPRKAEGADDPLVQPDNDPAMPTAPWQPMTGADVANDPRDPGCDSAGAPVAVPVFAPPKGTR